MGWLPLAQVWQWRPAPLGCRLQPPAQELGLSVLARAVGTGLLLQRAEGATVEGLGLLRRADVAWMEGAGPLLQRAEGLTAEGLGLLRRADVAWVEGAGPLLQMDAG